MMARVEKAYISKHGTSDYWIVRQLRNSMNEIVYEQHTVYNLVDAASYCLNYESAVVGVDLELEHFGKMEAMVLESCMNGLLRRLLGGK